MVIFTMLFFCPTDHEWFYNNNHVLAKYTLSGGGTFSFCPAKAEAVPEDLRRPPLGAPRPPRLRVDKFFREPLAKTGDGCKSLGSNPGLRFSLVKFGECLKQIITVHILLPN